MYYLIDLTNETTRTFETKVALLTHWRFRLHRILFPAPALNFKELNVTGKDTYTAAGIMESILRQFQVLDDEGRSQDIRTWTDEIEIVNAIDFPFSRRTPSQARFRIDPADVGSKLPVRKSRHNAFERQRLMDRQIEQLDSEDDLLGFTPIRDNSRPRPQSYERKDFHRRNRSRSWKAYTKNTSQWGRHTERAAETPIRKRTFEELDLEKLAAELIGTQN